VGAKPPQAPHGAPMVSSECHAMSHSINIENIVSLSLEPTREATNGSQVISEDYFDIAFLICLVNICGMSTVLTDKQIYKFIRISGIF